MIELLEIVLFIFYFVIQSEAKNLIHNWHTIYLKNKMLRSSA
jgi:hypothetical protein